VPETYRTTVTVTINGTAYPSVVDDASNGIERVTPSVPAAKVGSLTTRTDADTGVLTMNSGHGFATSDKLDVFWSGGSRRNMTATVATNAVTVDGGSGDDLPVVSTAVTACKPTTQDFTVDGDALVVLVAASPVPGYVVFVDDADAEVTDATFYVDANAGANWTADVGTDNPLAGVVTSKVKFSHGSTTARTMTAVGQYN